MPTSEREQHITFAVLCVAMFLDMGDSLGLAGTFLAMQREIGFGPGGMAAITVSQNVTFAVFVPIWGWLADRRCRIHLLATSCFLWCLLNIASGAAKSLEALICTRALLGAALGGAQPLAQSLVFDIAANGKQTGLWFGFFMGAGFCGSGVITFFSTWASEEIIIGTSGWRFVMYTLSTCCGALGIVALLVAREPERNPGLLADGVARENGLRAQWSHAYSCSCLALRDGMCMGILTWCFVVINLQGITGMAAAFGYTRFIALYLQYSGFSDFDVATITAMLYVGGTFGAPVGGFLGDAAALRAGVHGRALCAVASVALFGVMAVLVFHGLPRGPALVPLYCLVVFVTGLVCTWADSAAALPVLGMIVPPDRRGIVIAWQRGVQTGLGAIIGNTLPAYFMVVNGYIPYAKPVAELTPEERDGNVKALQRAILSCCIPCWLLTGCLYCTLGFAFARDVKRRTARMHTVRMLSDAQSV